jgi:hypothetical protein
LDPSAVGGPALKATKGINLGYEVALADASDCRIARHLRDRSTIKGHERHRHSHAGGSGGRLTARMAGAHNHDIHPRHPYFPMQNEP